MDFRITIEGTDALLMHNARLANPLDPAAKAVKKLTGKRNKTDDDYEELARVEWTGSFYFDPDVGPFIPGDNIWRALYDAAKKHKKGPRIKEGVFISTNVNPIAYGGPRALDFNRRFDVRQARLEQAIRDITDTQDQDRKRTDEDVAELRDRLA